jgi:hypothetical protein
MPSRAEIFFFFHARIAERTRAAAVSATSMERFQTVVFSLCFELKKCIADR